MLTDQDRMMAAIPAAERYNKMVHTPARVNILGVMVNDVSMDEAVSMVLSMTQDGGSHHVVTVNPEFVMTARSNDEFRDTLNNADLAVPDGIGILKASQILGHPMRERVTGVDLVHRIAEAASKRRISFFLLGAAPGVAEITARKLQSAHPGLVIAGTYAGSPDPAEDERLCTLIGHAEPDILLVAYGAPKQDLWIRRNQQRLHVPVAMGVGGTFDFIAGVAVRAPRWMQKSGLEWLHRLLREPSRWRRMLALPRFALRVLHQRIAGNASIEDERSARR